jgi:hypothetical protein
LSPLICESPERAGRLRHTFDRSMGNTGCWEMPTNCGSLMLTFLIPIADRRRHVDDAIDHQERIAMRQRFEIAEIFIARA